MLLKAVALLLACVAPWSALAAEVTFPKGSRIGLEPPPGMEASKRFAGFERHGGGATITLVEMPPQASQDLRSMTAESFRAQGFEVRAREEIKLSSGADAILFSGDQLGGAGPTVRRWVLVASDPTVTALVVGQAVADLGSDEAMRAAMTSVAIRPPLALEDQVAALPFRLGDRAGFRPVRVLGGSAVLLTDGAQDTFPGVEQPIVIVAQSADPAPPAEQRDALARALLASNATLKDFSLERSGGFRQRGADWHEIVARATDVPSSVPVVVSQTIRFAPSSYLRIVGITRADARSANLPRFRALADGVEVE